MRFAPPSLQFIAAATTNTTMSSSRFNTRGRNPWPRGYCDRPPWYGHGDGRGGERGGGGAFVSGDSHVRTVRNANYESRQGHRGDIWIPRGAAAQQQFGPWTQGFRSPPPPPRPRAADHRNWSFSQSQPPPHCERFVVLSYNILADYLARDHQAKLYFHIPDHVLDWEWRKRRIFFELGLWAPDIMCLQEVDRFHDLEEELAIRGYMGIWKMRTGNAVDGCAIFWRTNRFQLRHEEHIEFNKHGLRDNVAQICVLESRIQSPWSSSMPASSDQSRGPNQVVICNIHVLYNPKRGEIKLGQVRVLLDRAYAISRIWNGAPVIICGDFNCTPESPLYNFISEQKLNLSGLARNQVSGQYSASIYAPHPYVGSGLHRPQPTRDNCNETRVGVDQGNYHVGNQNQYKPRNDMANATLTDNFSSSQRMVGMLDVSEKPCSDDQNVNDNNTISDAVTKAIDGKDILDDQCVESSSTQCSLLDPSKETVKLYNKHSGNIGNYLEQKLTPTVSCDESLCSGGVQNEHGGRESVVEIVHSIQSMLNEQCSQSDPMVPNEWIDNLDLVSSSKNHDSSQGFTDSATEVETVSNLYTGTLAVSRMHEDITYYEVQKENLNVGGTPSGGTTVRSSNDLVSKDIPDAETTPDNKLLEDIVTEVSLSKMISGTLSANIEVFITKGTDNPSSDLDTEHDKAEPVISCLHAFESHLSDLSTCGDSSLDLKLVDLSANEVSKTTVYPHSDGDHGTVDSSETMACIPESVPSQDTICYNKCMQTNSEEASQSSGKDGATGGLHIGLVEDHIGVGQGDGLTDIYNSEKTCDPNFLEELHGTENVCEVREEFISMPSSTQSQSSSFIGAYEARTLSSFPGHVLGKEGEADIERLNSTYPHASKLDPPSSEVTEDSSSYIPPPDAILEKHSFNPYLWTPMEIEVASGNAECTIVEHNLKLRSAYTEVEDYAGTKGSNREPQVTSYNRLFMGTVDYIWFSEGLQTIRVLDTIPKSVLQRTPGFPTQKWGSDHLALACQFAFTKNFPTKQT